ncbi:hypothetical protein DY000_02008684 [Brassica cretica]|uniref:FKB95-like N-terminal Kelch domain-containing protein n=1 Tax=Brassica cretica TaxID=69181 RepID=A0ABQ7CGJ3_BRACR|nr:hypothetical protein DY000_02008684 [Brassica cretica]
MLAMEKVPSERALGGRSKVDRIGGGVNVCCDGRPVLKRQTVRTIRVRGSFRRTRKQSGTDPSRPGPFMYGSRVAMLHGAKIVFIGGYSVVEGSSIDGTGISSSADVYEWRKLASMNIPRHDFACAVVDGLLYVVRGKDSCREHILSAEVYNPETNLWSLMDCPDRHVLGDFAFSFKSKLYAVSNGSRFIDVYDPKTKTWEELDSGKSLLVYSYTVIRNKVYFLDYNMSGLGVFDLEENSWSSVFVPHESRSDSWLRLREWNNKVILIAGFRGYNALTGDLDKEDASKMDSHTN